jgi:hypothetical protein
MFFVRENGIAESFQEIDARFSLEIDEIKACMLGGAVSKCCERPSG